MPWRVGSAVSDARRSFLADHERGVPLEVLLEAYDIKKSAAYELLRRGRELPVDEAVAVKSRAPHRHPNALGDDVIRRVVRLKRSFPKWGPKKLAGLFADRFGGPAPSITSIGNILKARGMTRINRPSRRHPSTQLMTHAAQANDVWATDHKGKMKGLGVEPLTVIDLHSRYWLRCRPFTDKSHNDTRIAFEELFDDVGMPLVIRIDGGQPWASASGPLRLTQLSAWWVALGVRIEIAPTCQQNGCIERLHGTMEREMSMATVDVRQHFERERRIYNEVRPHEGIGMATPSALYRKSPRRPVERVFDATEIGCDESRPVQRDGSITWKGSYPYISRALAGRRVGFRRRGLTTWTAHFFELELGTLDKNGFSPNYT